MSECEGCGTHGPGVKFTRIHVTNGVLTLCDTCRDDVNRKSPLLAVALEERDAALRRVQELEAELARLERLMELEPNEGDP